MQPHRFQWHMFWALLLGSGLTLLLWLLGMVGWYVSPAAEFNRARSAWQAQPVPHYRLVIERPQIWCQQDVEVRYEQIAQVIENTCPIESLTVSTLFQRIADLDGQRTDAFLPRNLCTCTSALQASVVYDSEQSFPREVTIVEQRGINWRELSCWRDLLLLEPLPACDLPPALAQPRITHISLIPLVPVSSTD